MEINVIFVLELIGTAAFAVSGASVAMRKEMDVLGVCILGMTTAVGGGFIRDIVLDITPPTAFDKPIYVVTALVVSIIAFLPNVRKKIDMNSWFYWIIDSIGLAVFTMAGALAGVSSQNPFLIVFVANVTGVGGGVIRDIFADRKPVIFQENVYATASLAGAIIFGFISYFNQYIAVFVGGIVIFILRIFAIKFKWDLPKA